MVQASVHARLLHTVEQKALFYIFSKSRFTGVIRLGFAVPSSCSYFCENTSTTRVMSLMPRYWPGYWNCCKSWASSVHMRSKPRQLWCGCHHFHDPRNAWLDAPRWGFELIGARCSTTSCVTSWTIWTKQTWTSQASN